MPTEVKICGLSDEGSVDAALEAGADLIGFVLFPPSPRNVSLQRAVALAERVRGRAGIVALTVDASDALFVEIGESLRPDLVQLHGRETPARIGEARALARSHIMKAIGISTLADLDPIAGYGADRLLLDAKPPRDASRPGGHGRTFDWALLDGFVAPVPWLLSGGLDASNVAAALAATGAPGVDVSSGVEQAPGRKDPALVQAFVEAVRAHDRAQQGDNAKQEERAA